VSSGTGCSGRGYGRLNTVASEYPGDHVPLPSFAIIGLPNYGESRYRLRWRGRKGGNIGF
jgi:hypothetical protein